MKEKLIKLIPKIVNSHVWWFVWLLFMVTMLGGCTSSPEPEIKYVTKVEYKIPDGYIKEPDSKLVKYVRTELPVIVDGRRTTLLLWVKDTNILYRQCAANNNALVNSIKVQK